MRGTLVAATLVGVLVAVGLPTAAALPVFGDGPLVRNDPHGPEEPDPIPDLGEPTSALIEQLTAVAADALPDDVDPSDELAAVFDDVASTLTQDESVLDKVDEAAGEADETLATVEETVAEVVDTVEETVGCFTAYQITIPRSVGRVDDERSGEGDITLEAMVPTEVWETVPIYDVAGTVDGVLADVLAIVGYEDVVSVQDLLEDLAIHLEWKEEHVTWVRDDLILLVPAPIDLSQYGIDEFETEEVCADQILGLQILRDGDEEDYDYVHYGFSVPSDAWYLLFLTIEISVITDAEAALMEQFESLKIGADDAYDRVMRAVDEVRQVLDLRFAHPNLDVRAAIVPRASLALAAAVPIEPRALEPWEQSEGPMPARESGDAPAPPLAPADEAVGPVEPLEPSTKSVEPKRERAPAWWSLLGVLTVGLGLVARRRT